MPNRILHERICVSETIAQLTSDEERFFYRLIVQCDDFGRFDGRASVIRARCFALQLDTVSDEAVAGWLDVLTSVGLVAMYEVDGRSFLQVTTWERYQQTRAKRSKYPDPMDDPQSPDSNGYHAPAYVPEKREARSEKRSSIHEKRDASSEIDDDPEIGADAPPTPATDTEKPKRRKAGTPVPDEFPLEEKHFEYAAGLGLDRAVAENETALFLSYHQFHGTLGANWYAGWQKWIRDAVGKFAPRASPGHRNGSSRPPPNGPASKVMTPSDDPFQTRYGSLPRR